jgi:hypothetical protein
MTHRRKLLIGFLLIGLVPVGGAGWWWYTRSQSPPFKAVLRGSTASSGNLGVSGGNLVVVPPVPGVFFGTVKKPDTPEQFTYVILFRYGRSRTELSNSGIQFHCTSSGGKADTKDAIELNGRRIDAAYHIELNPEQTAVASEHLTIGGKSVDMTAGQVFLIDLTAETPTYHQKKVELPAIPSKLESTKDVEQLAEAIRKSLAGHDPEFQEFVR